MDNDGKQPTSSSSSTNNRQQQDHHESLRVEVHADVSTTAAITTPVDHIVSTSDDEQEEDWSDSDAYGNGYDYFDIIEEEAAEFLEEGQGSNSEEDHDDGMEEGEEDEIDPDHMSYEELLALSDLIGREKRGLSLDQISAPGCLRPRRKLLELMMSSGDGDDDEVDRCVICQVEYGQGGEDELELAWEIVSFWPILWA